LGGRPATVAIPAAAAGLVALVLAWPISARAQAPAAAASWPADGASRPRVLFELRADNPRTRLERVEVGGTTPVCSAPCRRSLDPGKVYVIAGDGIRATSRFMLPDRDMVTMDVRAGSTVQLGLGSVLIGAGVVSAAAGVFVWEIGVLTSLDAPNDSHHTEHVGIGMIAVGVPVALIGAFLAVTSHTSVTSSSGVSFTRDDRPVRAPPRIALTARGLEF
jgi:hypothetical protein